MAVCCDLEVDVNGEETFMVDKKIIASYCGRLSKLFGKSTGSARNLKVILMTSWFCYNNGRTVINPSNISLLYSAAQFMEMNISVSGTHNLLEETGKSLEEMKYWTWSELLITTKKCQDLLPFPNSTGILENPSPCPSTSSPDSSGARLSCDTRSTESLKNSFSRATWWFDDLLFLSTNLVGMVIETMVSKKFDHVIISRFLFITRIKCYTGTSDDKRKAVETVIDLLCILDWNSVSFKSLFGILRVALNCNIRKCSRAKLESMIGSQMDQATLDNLLIPSPHGMNYSYDVNLVLRFLKAFLHGGISLLMDLYIAEVAPDPCLKPYKFLALAMALPDSARESYDGIYRATDMYLELSAEACLHLYQNKTFPSKSAVQALLSQQAKLKRLLKATDKTKCYTDSSSGVRETGSKERKKETSQQIVVYARKLDLPTDNNDKIRAHLKGMQWRVTELERVCMKMQAPMTKIMNSRVSRHSSSRSLPRLCS
ncbi:BTB/POZ domain-containing protein [Salix suchowensis]|nr:BTB/POZ domain-containing protein [Salix suchowensis]